MRRLNRRHLLRGAVAGGSVAIGLPLLEAMMPRKAEAQQGQNPKRLVLMFSPNGSLPQIWSPANDLSDLAGHPIHDSLAIHRDKLLFLDGVDDTMAKNSIGDGHQTGMACLWTNRAILPGSEFCEGNCDPPVYVGWGGGISIDQWVADQIQAAGIITKFRSLDFGVQVKSSSVWSRMSYTGPDQPVPHREDPNQNFMDLFSDLDADPFELELLRNRRKSVLDAVIKDYEGFQMRLGAKDKIRVEQHLSAIRSLELQLEATGGVGAACELPTVQIPNNYDQNDNFPATGKAQMDMIAMALACDMTRVASLQWARAVSNVQFNWIPQILNEGHHSLSHYGDGDGNAESDIREINKWYTEQFSYLLSLMDSMDEGDGSLLDNSVVVWGNELGKGNSHTRNDIPFILAGGCKGYFNTGRRIDYGGEDHGKLLVSLTHAMDFPQQTFGEAQYSNGPLSGLT